MQHVISIFDRSLLRKRRDRAAAGFREVDFLKKEAAEGLIERLNAVRRHFPLALDLGSHDGTLARMLGTHPSLDRLISADLSPAMLSRADGLRVACDEEHLPFAGQSLDAIFSLLSLQHVNDLPGALIQMRRALKPDGLLLAVLPGAQTLIELREALAEAEAAMRGGISPRVSPFVEVRDAGGLLQRAGFALPVVDRELVTLSYSNPFALMQELRAMGEANPLRERARRFTPRALLLDAAARYQARHGDHEGRVPATVELVTLTAWAPAPGQQKPLARGSGQIPLGQALQ